MHVYHHVLGTSPEASDEEIRRRYLEQVKIYSPESDPMEFQRLTKAYEGLLHRRARAGSLFRGFSDFREFQEGLAWLTGEPPVERRRPTLKEILAAEGVAE